MQLYESHTICVKLKTQVNACILYNFNAFKVEEVSELFFIKIFMLLLINDGYFLQVMRLLVLHGFADGLVVWLIRGEVELHAYVETHIC